MSLTIRRAATEDVPYLLDQLQRFDQFFGAGRSLYPDDATATAILSGLIKTQPFWVAFHDDLLIGFIGGALAAHPFNPDLVVLSELFWWVDEAYRGSKAGLELLTTFIDHGQQHADWIVMTLEHESPISDRCLLKRGFRPKEHTYLLEVE